MVRARVLLDVDGVLADFLSSCLEIVNELSYPMIYTHDHLAGGWHIFQTLCVSREIEEETWIRMKREGWCDGLRVYPGAVEGVARLREIADVYIVTSPMDGAHWSYEREKWLKRHFDIERKYVIHTESKHVVAGDVLVDDKTDNLVRWSRCNPTGAAVRWTNVTNENEPYDGDTVDDWSRLLDLIKIHGCILNKQRTWRTG